MIIGEESIKYSLKNLWQQKSRSLLTILSIFIGITTIFIFISFGIGLYDYVNQFATDSSADKITIMPKGTGAPGMDDTFSLTKEDVEAIERVSGVYEATGLYAKAAEVKQGKILKYTFLIGYEPDKPLVWEIANIKVFKGRELKGGDKAKAVLGYNYQIKDRIFPKPYEVGGKIEIQGEKLTIVGILESVGNPQDDAQIYIASDYMEELYLGELKGYGWVIAKVDRENINQIIKQVEDSLRKSRGLEKGKEDFFVQSWQDLMETYSAVMNGVVGFVILVALISVIVSAINTTNTMVTSVLERKREIGVMKAVGAKNKEIFSIFLFESAILGFIAGAFGVALGWILTNIAGIILKNIGWGFLSPHYSWQLFTGLIAFAVLTGAISGAVPAWRASKTNPVEALRYE